jgi:Nucleotide-sugar transporter
MNATESAIVTFLVELIKTAISYTFFALLEKKSLYVDRLYVVPALLIFIQNTLFLRVYHQIRDLLFQICFHSRTFFVFFLSYILLNKRYSGVQYLSQGMLFAGVGIEVLSTAKGEGRPEILGALLTILASLLNTLAAVYFEAFLKDSGKGTWENAFVLGLFSSMFSGTYVAYRLSALQDSVDMFRLDRAACIVLMVGMGLSLSFLVMRFSAIAKNFLAVGSSSLISLLFTIQFSETFSPWTCLSAVAVFGSIFLFNSQELKKARKGRTRAERSKKGLGRREEKSRREAGKGAGGKTEKVENMKVSPTSAEQ